MAEASLRTMRKSISGTISRQRKGMVMLERAGTL